MTVTIVRDGKSVDFDESEAEEAFRWTGDPDLTADLLDVLATGSATLLEPGLKVLFYADTPVYNVVAAAMSLGCAIESTDEDDLDASLFKEETSTILEGGETVTALTEHDEDADELDDLNEDADILVIH